MCALHRSLFSLKEIKWYSFQNYHMNSLGWSDVGYNFLIGEDGYIYEGRGFYRQGPGFAHYPNLQELFCQKNCSVSKIF